MPAAYDPIAAWYDEFVRAGPLLHAVALPVVLDLAGDVAAQRVCDLACGQGIAARALAARGATVVGIDVSAELLAIARRHEAAEPHGIQYRQGDAQRLDGIPDASFDGVLCNVALMDIPDLPATCRAVARVLRPAGWFVASITHPCFQTPASKWLVEADGTAYRAVRRYFAEGAWRSDNPHGVRGQVGAHHRTLSTYLNAAAAAGLSLERVAEPPTTRALAEPRGAYHPGFEEVPGVLAAHWAKR